MPLPNLLVSKGQAKEMIAAQLKRGREIRNITQGLLTSKRDLETARAERSKWVKYTTSLLEQLFDNPSLAQEFSISHALIAVGGIPDFRRDIEDFQQGIDTYLNRLESIHERLDLVREFEQPVFEKPQSPTPLAPTIFISHSSEDVAVIDAVKQAFEDLTLTPVFNEKQPAGGPPANVISQRIQNSKALFAFFTTNSVHNMDTRDWIIFELGLALAHGKKIFSWKDEGVSVLPKLVEQITTYRPFEGFSNRGALRLTGEVRRVAKELA